MRRGHCCGGRGGVERGEVSWERQVAAGYPVSAVLTRPGRFRFRGGLVFWRWGRRRGRAGQATSRRSTSQEATASSSTVYVLRTATAVTGIRWRYQPRRGW